MSEAVCSDHMKLVSPTFTVNYRVPKEDKLWTLTDREGHSLDTRAVTPILNNNVSAQTTETSQVSMSNKLITEADNTAN